jgi:hypothetical protein
MQTASYECPMNYRTFIRSNVGKVAEHCLTLSFASVFFPPQIEAFLPEGNTPGARLNRSSDTSQLTLMWWKPWHVRCRISTMPDSSKRGELSGLTRVAHRWKWRADLPWEKLNVEFPY